MSTQVGFAHSGQTDATGCHNVSATGKRHCHNKPGKEKSTRKEKSATCPNKYYRKEWRHWAKVPQSGRPPYWDVRQEVLVDETLAPVTYKRNGKVLTGKWSGFYTDIIYTSASDLDIDHVVPLAEAHRSGGWQWDNKTKSRYANDMENPDHLMAVLNSANRTKSDKDPAKWLPRHNQVEYARIWADIKIHWGLTADRDEIAALRRLLGSSAALPKLAKENPCGK